MNSPVGISHSEELEPEVQVHRIMKSEIELLALSIDILVKDRCRRMYLRAETPHEEPIPIWAINGSMANALHIGHKIVEAEPFQIRFTLQHDIHSGAQTFQSIFQKEVIGIQPEEPFMLGMTKPFIKSIALPFIWL